MEKKKKKKKNKKKQKIVSKDKTEQLKNYILNVLKF